MCKIVIVFSLFFMLSGCSNKGVQPNSTKLQADENNGGITLPEGFKGLVVMENLGHGRHIAIHKNGDIYMALEKPENGKGIVAIRDEDGDGKGDLIRYFGNFAGTGINIYNGYLYFAADTAVLRYQFIEGQLVPDTLPELVVGGFLPQEDHASKAITIDLLGNLYVNVGAPSNACMQETPTMGPSGTDPCPQLQYQAGIWKFSANKTGQDHVKDGYRYATGIRHAIALEWNKAVNSLYAVQHGRDQLSQLFPDTYTENDGANLPAEEFIMIEDGDDFGWPYCYYDPFEIKKVLSPEYGGNGNLVGRCENAKGPMLAFPAHIAPNALTFYHADMFPDKYKNGAFVAFQGKWDMASQEEEGCYVTFVPFYEMFPIGQWEVFADGFAGAGDYSKPGEAVHRPAGVAVGPDGSLYISGSGQGTIWRVFYQAEE
jgi:glucose/arabinose dehydrogenase